MGRKTMAWLWGMGGVTLVILSFFMVADQGVRSGILGYLFYGVYDLFIRSSVVVSDLIGDRFKLGYHGEKILALLIAFSTSLIVFTGIGYLLGPFITHTRRTSTITGRILKLPRFLWRPSTRMGLVVGAFGGMLAMMGLAFSGGGHGWGTYLLHYCFTPVMALWNGIQMEMRVLEISFSGDWAMGLVIFMVYAGGLVEGWIIGWAAGWVYENTFGKNKKIGAS